MKKIILIIFLLVAVKLVYAQAGGKLPICYGRSYTYTSSIETDLCAGAQLSIKVKRSSGKTWCTIYVDDKKIRGFLVRNSDPSNKAYGYLYDFHRKREEKYTCLFMKFYLDGHTYMADVINENWIQTFKTCFDNKILTLKVE